MDGAPNRTAEEVFDDFEGRRAGLIKALTSDFESFYQQCDPDKEHLWLYGYPDETWEVNIPVENLMVPPDLPEPRLGINFARDGLLKPEWLKLVANHCDSWLVAVAFFFGSRFDFGSNERMRLFQMINELPTVTEVVKANLEQENDQSGDHNSSSSSITTSDGDISRSKETESGDHSSSSNSGEDISNSKVTESRQSEHHNKGVKIAAGVKEENDQSGNHNSSCSSDVDISSSNKTESRQSEHHNKGVKTAGSKEEESDKEDEGGAL